MGVLKIGQRKSGVGSYCKQISNPSNGEGMVEKEENPVMGSDSWDDYDDCELTKVSCELGMVEGQLCSIPYELYDLPDLREIFSLDTWNSCLTDEERFSLSAYLPDMDQQTFCSTIKELLGGSNIYFGNPMDMFFKRLKGGFYPPKVTRFREGLQFVQMRKYYHSLRSYHDNMAQMFMEMRRVWDQCGKSAGIEERVDVWKTRRKHKGDYLLDLNTVPKDGYLLSEEVKSNAVMCHLSKKMKSVEGKRPNNILPSLSTNGIKFVAPNCSAKGVLKVKALGNGSFKKHHPKIVFSDMFEKCRSVPKGVLKVVPKVPSIRLEQSKVVPRQPQPSLLVSSQSLQDRKFSSFPASLYFGDAGGLCESPFPQRKVSGSEIHTTLDLEQPPCILSLQESSLRTSGCSESSTRKIKREMNPSLDDITNLGGYKLFGSDVGRGPYAERESAMNTIGARRYTFGGETLWKSLGGRNKELSVNSLEPYPFGIQYSEGERHMEPLKEEHVTVYKRIPEAASIASDIGISKQEMSLASSSDQMKGQSDVGIRKSEKLFSKPTVSEGFKDDPVLPLTYKRRKAKAKLNSFDFGRPLMEGVDLNCVIPKESNQQSRESTKGVKIKFTGWKDTPLDKEP